MVQARDFDFFGSPIQLNLGRLDKKQQTKEYTNVYQSNFGSVITLFGIFLSVVYTGFMVIRMYNLEDDTYKS